MLARLQQLITLGLLAAAGGSAWWFVHDGRPERAWWVAAVIVLGYASFMALEFLVMRLVHRDDPAPRATVAQLVKAWWGEIVTAPRIFCWQQPFRSRRFADHLPAGSRAHGVVLVHGFVCNRGFWNRWMQELRRRNIPFVAVNLEPILGSIADYGSIIEHAVRQIEVTTGRAPVIVGHSMGGLAARVWMAEHRGAVRAHRVITIGSPHQGTWPARFGWSTNAREMRQTSVLQTGLQAQESVQSNARFTCFYGHCDNIVFPASSGTLPGADNRHLEGVAHVHMADHPAVLAEALHWIAAEHGSDATEPMPMAPLSGK